MQCTPLRTSTTWLTRQSAVIKPPLRNTGTKSVVPSVSSLMSMFDPFFQGRSVLTGAIGSLSPPLRGEGSSGSIPTASVPGNGRSGISIPGLKRTVFDLGSISKYLTYPSGKSFASAPIVGNSFPGRLKLKPTLGALFLQQGFHDGAGDAVVPGARLFVDVAGLSGIAAGERGVERTQVAHAARLQQDAAGGIHGPGHARADLQEDEIVPQLEAAPLRETPPGVELAQLRRVGRRRLENDEQLGRVARLDLAAAELIETRGARPRRIRGHSRPVDVLQRPRPGSDSGKLRLEELEELIRRDALEAEPAEVGAQEGVPGGAPHRLLQLAQQQVSLLVRDRGGGFVRINPAQIGAQAGELRAGGEALQRYLRSEERRVGKECRSRWSPYH